MLDFPFFILDSLIFPLSSQFFIHFLPFTLLLSYSFTLFHHHLPFHCIFFSFVCMKFEHLVWKDNRLPYDSLFFLLSQENRERKKFKKLFYKGTKHSSKHFFKSYFHFCASYKKLRAYRDDMFHRKTRKIITKPVIFFIYIHRWYLQSLI